jgi:rubrerythrin
MSMNTAQLKEHLLQSHVHERGGTLVYKAALECTVNDDLHEEWEKYLQQTQNHVVILAALCRKLGWDPGEMTPGCKIVQHNGIALVRAMEMARAEGDPVAAELVACDSVLLAETKDHANWEIICECAKSADGVAGEALKAACEEVEEQEDEHLYHTQGWGRELRLQALGLKAVLPPPEEKTDAKSASEAEAARKSR